MDIGQIEMKLFPISVSEWFRLDKDRTAFGACFQIGVYTMVAESVVEMVVEVYCPGEIGDGRLQGGEME